MQIIHKEEAEARICGDIKDREGIRHKLELSINPLDPVSHSDGMVDIVSSKIGPATVIVQDSLEVRREQMT